MSNKDVLGTAKLNSKSMIRIPDKVLNELEVTDEDILAFLKTDDERTAMIKRGEVKV